MKHIQNLNLRLYLAKENRGSEPKEDSMLDSAMYYSKENICDLRDEQAVTQIDGVECLTDYGIYFGTQDSREPQFCPMHYFTGGGYVIKPITCNYCGDMMNGLIRIHHHTENGKDVTV